MTQRILLGLKGGAYGLWVSKPGLDISSSNDEDFLITPNRPIEQPFLSGHIKSDGSTIVSLKVTHSLGYIPVCIVFGQRQVVLRGPDYQQIYNSTIDTSALHIAGFDQNTTYVNYQGGGVNQPFGIDCTYVILRTALSTS